MIFFYFDESVVAKKIFNSEFDRVGWVILEKKYDFRKDELYFSEYKI